MTHSSGGLLDDLLVLITSVPDLVAHVWMTVKARLGMEEKRVCPRCGGELEYVELDIKQQDRTFAMCTQCNWGED